MAGEKMPGRETGPLRAVSAAARWRPQAEVVLLRYFSKMAEATSKPTYLQSYFQSPSVLGMADGSRLVAKIAGYSVAKQRSREPLQHML